MGDYVLSTNLYTFAQADEGFFGWPTRTGEAAVVREMRPGDVIIPKFAGTASWSESEADVAWQRAYLTSVEVDPDEARQRYDAEISSTGIAVPFLLNVTGELPDDERQQGDPWARVAVEKFALKHPLSLREFLLLRALPVEIAGQFKGTVAPGRHIQEVPAGTAQAVREVGGNSDHSQYLRHYTVVKAATAAEAVARMASRPMREGDRVFIASVTEQMGVHEADAHGGLHSVEESILRSPDQLLALLLDAQSKAVKRDYFAPGRAIAGARELKEFVESDADLLAIDDFGRFHDRYDLLARKVTQALAIAARPAPLAEPDSMDQSDETEGEGEPEADELAMLQGLTVEAVRAELPPNMVISDAVLAEAVTSLRAGKHLLLGGPPGTGKSTLAEALCRAVVDAQYDVVTGTADWTTFDTIGGYMPVAGGELKFEPGIVLRSLQRGRWLAIDELNRADIDKAFGPLFTLLAGSSGDQPTGRTVLPFQSAGKNIEIKWAEKRTGSPDEYAITPGWRLIGTLNLSDKATLFQLSFAFLRRFAVLDVPLPPQADYEVFFRDLCTAVSDAERDNVVAAAMSLAFGARQLGPAILKDIATFLATGLAATASGAPTYSDEVEAFATAVRLFAVPQYEGADASDVAAVVDVFLSVWPDRPSGDWAPLKQALAAVALS